MVPLHKNNQPNKIIQSAILLHIFLNERRKGHTKEWHYCELSNLLFYFHILLNGRRKGHTKEWHYCV